MFHLVTLSGTVSFIAITLGTPTSLSSSIGSGLITVLAQKFVLLPARLCLILPSLLFILSVNVFNGWPLLCLAGGNCAMLLSKNVVTWYCSRSQRSSTMISGAPALMFSKSLWLILTMSPSLWVRSSSLRSPLSRVMLGLMVTGGMGRRGRMVHSGRAYSGLSPRRRTSSLDTLLSHSRTSMGLSLLSFSMKVVGFSILMGFCFSPQCGHFLMSFDLLIAVLARRFCSSGLLSLMLARMALRNFWASAGSRRDL